MTSNVTVKRDGTVTRDGSPIGRVEKVMTESITDAVFGREPSQTQWQAFTLDGEKIGRTYDTRKRAGERLECHTRPMVATDVRRGSDFFSTRPYASAMLTNQGYSYGVTRYADENYWVVDFYYTPDSICPVWANGEGSRVTRAQVLNSELGDFVTDAATAAGVWPL